MIYPTARAVVLAAAGAPMALALGVLAPGLWLVGAAWLVFILGLVLVDAVVGPTASTASLAFEPPATIGVGRRGVMSVTASFSGRAPAAAQLTLGQDPLISADPPLSRLIFADGEGVARIALEPVRRGRAVVGEAWLRWRGALGLVWKQTHHAERREIAILPDLEGVKAHAIRLFAREALFGLKAQLKIGEGSDFHALYEAQGAVDPRAIDWKQSARHGKLLGKEFRTERNHPVVVAIDTGHDMCAPLAGAPRVDLAINAALLLAFVALKTGDRAAAYGFDARPRGFSGVVSGASAFPRIQRHLSALDYSEAETNFTLGLTQLGTQVHRRSLIVIFTDFADSTSAELMVENISRLLRRHVVLFVVFQDAELETLARAEPATPAVIAKAVTARTLLRAREVVLARLARLGVRIVDAPPSRLATALVEAYLEIKGAELL